MTEQVADAVAEVDEELAEVDDALNEEEANEEGVDEEGGEEELGEEGAEEEALAEGEEEPGEAEVFVDNQGTDISTNSFEDLVLDPTVVMAANDAWKLFISSAESREAAGEAIYAALFEGAPSLQSLFVTPRAVQAMRFMNGLAGFVSALDDPPKLKILVETLGFGHLHLDVTVARVIIFRDAIMDLFMIELAERFDTKAREGWNRLLNYVGGAIIYVKSHYAERINTLLKSWAAANHGDSSKQNNNDLSSAEDLAALTAKEAAVKKSKWSLFGSANTETRTPGKEGGPQEKGANDGAGGKDGNIGSQSVPTTYPEMFMFNAAVMGFGTNTWMPEVLACFNNIVTNVSNSSRLQEECDILALRIAKATKSEVKLPEYKSCMLASLRSLLPKDWDSAHEVAWTWLWDNVERLLLRVHGNPPLWEKALIKLTSAWDETQRFEIRKEIYARFFVGAPAGQDFFKQSNTYLHFIADKILNMTVELYQNPIQMVDDISALGLRHVGYAIPTELFSPFVTACVEVIMTQTKDECTVASFRYSLALISKMLTRTITEGSTIVMKAINSNSQKALKKAISCAPRGERSDWMLTVQVGTQSISPLEWSIESGNLEAAMGIIKDLLTIRADRDRYYFGVDKLFERHPDIIKLLCDKAGRTLRTRLLDCLIWRSRITENGNRRVNYYVKHLIVDADGNFSKALAWVAGTTDAKIICHPVMILVCDIVWSRVACRSFFFGKLWFFFTLVVFITSQSVLEHLGDGPNSDVERTLVFACRVLIYCASLTQLLYNHVRDWFKAIRKRETVKLLGVLPVPMYLANWQSCASFFLCLSLVGMLCLEPILWCWSYQNEKAFLQTCPEKAELRLPYSVFSMFAMLLYYTLLIDLTVVSTRISAFVLVCIRMISEVALFLGALFMCTLTFSSAASVVKHDFKDFKGIHVGMFALFKMMMGTYNAEMYETLFKEQALLCVVFVFLVTTVIFLLNLLIAQLSCAYNSVYIDMVGYARLERAGMIVEIMPSVPKARWKGFLESLRFHRRIEFQPGDVGLAGGLQRTEPANWNPTTKDMIRRFGGSTATEIPWPEEADQDDDVEDDRFERMEKLIQKTLRRVTDNAGSSKRGGGATSSGLGSGTGTKQSNSVSSGSVHESD